MAVSGTQPVFPPVTRQPITSQWGGAVSEGVIQRFTSEADRNAKWSSPPTGAMCVTTDTLTHWTYTGTAWIASFILQKQPFCSATPTGVAATGSLTTIPLGALGTNDPSTFDAPDTSGIRILRLGVYQIDVHLNYYSASTAGAINTTLTAVVMAGSEYVAQDSSHSSGHNHSLQMSRTYPINVANTVVRVDHADNAFRGLALDVALGKCYMSIARLGSL